MIGTFINIATVLIGGTLGLLLGARLQDRIRQTVVAGIGLFTLSLGIKMFFDYHEILVVLGSLLIGALIGEWTKLEDRLQIVGKWLENRFVASGDSTQQARFIQGFITVSLLFCTGPMAILGAIQDGLTGDYSLLAIKAILDGFAALAFASSLGIGVLFSVISLLVYQGGISLFAIQIQSIVTPIMMDEMSAVGGIILAGLAISSLLELKQIRTGSFLPAIFVAPILVAILSILGVAY